VFVHLLAGNTAANRSANRLQQRFTGQPQAGNCAAA
jgi:hypothetical protein